MKYTFVINTACFLIIISALFSCRNNRVKRNEIKPETQTVTEKDESDSESALLAGAASIDDATAEAYGSVSPNLTSAQNDKFQLGNSSFRDDWIIAPASTPGRDGLGPLLNAKSCGACHFKDGRGKPHDELFNPGVALLFRLSTLSMDNKGHNNPDPNYGVQFQPKSILSAGRAEGNVRITYEEITGNYPDGLTYKLRKPVYSFDSLAFGPLDAGIMISPRIASQLPGMGLLEAIAEETIISLADPFDVNADGISGKVNYAWDHESGIKKIGRFGWKANQPGIRQQVAAAFRNDVGITSVVFPEEDFSDQQRILFKDIPNGGTPELSDQKLDQVTFYCATLAVPIRRNVTDNDVIQGKKLFTQIGCNNCHVNELTTANYPLVPQFSGLKIRPYTDLLLHDMGDGLSDNSSDFEATGKEWRTPPLWGIGLIQKVNKHNFLLHDGRARGFEEAILWHGGESERTTTEFTKLTASQRTQLIKFLENL